MSHAAKRTMRRDAPAWWLLCAALLVFATTLAYSVNSDLQHTDQEARISLQAQAAAIGSEIERRLTAIDGALSGVRESLPYWANQKNGPDLALRHLSAVSKALEGVRTLSFLDANGVLVYSNRPDVIGKNFAERDYFKKASLEANPAVLYLTPPIKSVLGVYVMLVLKSVTGPQGEFAGIVVAALEPDELRSLLTGTRSTPDVAAGIVHGGGKVFMFAPDTLSHPGADADTVGQFFSRFKALGHTQLVLKGWSPALQLERMVAIQAVQPVALKMNHGLLVSVGRSEQMIFAAWRQHSFLLLGIFATVTLLSSVGLFVYQRRQVALRSTAESLRESEVRFSAFFHNAMVGMATTSLDKGWLQVNPALCDILGYSREDLVRKSWPELTHPDDLAADVAQFARLLSGESDHYSLEKRFIRPGGEVVHAFVAVRTVRDDQENIDFFAAVVVDISERKNAERQTRSATQMMQRFIDHIPGLAYVKDSDSRIMMANRGFDELGYDHTQLIGKTNLEVIPGPVGEKLTRDDARVAQSGQPEVLLDELQGRFFESRRFIIDDDNGHRLIGGLTLDVTQRQRYIERAQVLLTINDLAGKMTEKEFLTQGLELAEGLTGSGIAFLHFVNEDQESIELVTWTRNSLKGCTAVYESHYPISQAGIWADCFREEQAVVFNDYAAYRAKKGLPPGHAPLQRLISVPVVENGRVCIMLGMGNKRSDYDEFDIESVQLIGNDLWRIARRERVESMLKQRLDEVTALNKKLAEAQGQLLQSEKLSAIGQLAAGVAHEINNPIGFVQSNLGSLAEYVDDLLAVDRAYTAMENHVKAALPLAFDRIHAMKKEMDHDFVVNDAHQLLKESTDGLQRVKEIVQNLKDFSRVGETGWLWADLHQGLESTLNIVRNEVKYKAEVLRDFGELPPVYCIPSQINQVFMNLLVNAAQAIASHGHITLRTGCDGDTAWVEVQDDGCGIAADKLARVFEPFYTTKPVGKGTGLGLSLAWGIVQRHQGKLDLTSEPGKGSTFRVSLPVNGPTIAAETAPAQTTQAIEPIFQQ